MESLLHYAGTNRDNPRRPTQQGIREGISRQLVDFKAALIGEGLLHLWA